MIGFYYLFDLDLVNISLLFYLSTVLVAVLESSLFVYCYIAAASYMLFLIVTENLIFPSNLKTCLFVIFISIVLGSLCAWLIKLLINGTYTNYQINYSIVVFMIFVVNMHEMQFIFRNRFGHKKFSIGSFAIEHNSEFYLAFAFSIFEFFFEQKFFKAGKDYWIDICFLPGLALAICGETIRTVAVVQSNQHFGKRFVSSSGTEIKLITSGIYSWCRQPYYLGYTLSALSLQFMTANFISIIMFFPVIYEMISDQIFYIEYTMFERFGNSYIRYRNATPFVYPFVNSRITLQKFKDLLSTN